MIVRFLEFSRYDITQDCDVVSFMGSTLAGSYHVELPCTTSRALRESRAKFKDKVVEMMEDGKPPCEVKLG